MIKLIVVCKGHLVADLEDCLKCKIGPSNTDEPCFRPVLLNPEYNNRSALNELRKYKDDTYNPEFIKNYINQKMEDLD